MLGDVLEGLETAEVDGDLDIVGIATDVSCSDRDRNGRAAGGGPDRIRQTSLRPNRGGDAARERAEVPQQVVDLAADQGEHPLAGRRIALDRLGGEIELEP